MCDLCYLLCLCLKKNPYLYTCNAYMLSFPIFLLRKILTVKYSGCILEFTDERNRELMRAFRQVLSQRKFIDIAEISQTVVNMPCSRFWVSEERATGVVAALIKGKPVLDVMRPTKREMFTEIFRRVMDIRKECDGLPLAIIVMRVVNSPAPKFYMKPRCAMEIIYKIKKGFYEKQKRRY